MPRKPVRPQRLAAEVPQRERDTVCGLCGYAAPLGFAPALLPDFPTLAICARCELALATPNPPDPTHPHHTAPLRALAALRAPAAPPPERSRPALRLVGRSPNTPPAPDLARPLSGHHR